MSFVSWGHPKEALAADSGREFCPCDTPSGVLCPALGSSAKERFRPAGVSPEWGYRSFQRTGRSLLWRQAERVGVFMEKEDSGKI